MLFSHEWYFTDWWYLYGQSQGTVTCPGHNWHPQHVSNIWAAVRMHWGQVWLCSMTAGCQELTDNHAGRRSPAEALQESCFRNISREAVSWLLFHNWPWAQKALGKCVLTPVMSYPFKCCTLCLHDYHEAQISGEITAVNVHGVQAFLLIGQLWFSSLSHADGRCHLLVSSVWKALCHSLIIYIYIYMFFSAL